jgi:hypothetical protein
MKDLYMNYDWEQYAALAMAVIIIIEIYHGM